jgi:hypothetical protein
LRATRPNARSLDKSGFFYHHGVACKERTMPEKKLDWKAADAATDAAKLEAWRKKFGDQTPHRAWYYADSGVPALDESFCEALRDKLWSYQKRRVVSGTDANFENSSVFPGCSLLRVSLPDRLAASFVVGERTFVLYKAMRSGEAVDFGAEWEGLPTGRSGAHTVFINPGSSADLRDAPPPSALLRRQQKAVEENTPPAPAADPKDVSSPEPTEKKKVITDPTFIHGDGEATTEEPPVEQPVERPDSPSKPVEAMVVARAPRGWNAFGGKPSTDPGPAQRPGEPPPAARADPPPEPEPERELERAAAVPPKAETLIAPALLLMILAFVALMYAVYFLR